MNNTIYFYISYDILIFESEFDSGYIFSDGINFYAYSIEDVIFRSSPKKYSKLEDIIKEYNIQLINKLDDVKDEPIIGDDYIRGTISGIKEIFENDQEIAELIEKGIISHVKINYGETEYSLWKFIKTEIEVLNKYFLKIEFWYHPYVILSAADYNVWFKEKDSNIEIPIRDNCSYIGPYLENKISKNDISKIDKLVDKIIALM